MERVTTQRWWRVFGSVGLLIGCAPRTKKRGAVGLTAIAVLGVVSCRSPAPQTDGYDGSTLGEQPRQTLRYGATGQARSIWTAEIASRPITHAQTTARLHLRPSREASSKVSLYATIDRPFVRDEPHRRAAESERVGDTILILHRFIDVFGEPLASHQQIFREPGKPAGVVHQLLAWTYGQMVLPLPAEAVGAGARWSAASQDASTTVTLVATTAEHVDVVVESKEAVGGGSLWMTGRMTLTRPSLMVTSALLDVRFGWWMLHAPIAAVEILQTPVDVLPGPGYPRPITSIQRRPARCTTAEEEPGIVCTADDLCCNPCLPNMATADGVSCHAQCARGEDCSVGDCDDGVCVHDSEPDCPAPETCRADSGDYGRRCPGDTACVALCPSGQRLLGGTHCVRPCRTDADCPAGYCREGGGFKHCSGLCPSAGCPYLYD